MYVRCEAMSCAEHVSSSDRVPAIGCVDAVALAAPIGGSVVALVGVGVITLKVYAARFNRQSKDEAVRAALSGGAS
jgi:hypothetical protein